MMMRLDNITKSRKVLTMYLDILGTIRINNFEKDFKKKVDDFVKDLDLNEEYIVLHDNYDGNYRSDYDMSFANITSVKNFDRYLPDRNLIQIAAKSPHSSQTLPELWKQIWDLEEDGVLHRAYLYDIEYHQKDGTVAILLGTRD